MSTRRSLQSPRSSPDFFQTFRETCSVGNGASLEGEWRRESRLISKNSRKGAVESGSRMDGHDNGCWVQPDAIQTTVIRDRESLYRATDIPEFTIDTSSPLRRSKVKTPLLGFSMRKTFPNGELSHQRILNRERLGCLALPPGGPAKLEATSELVYPDGHVSMITSPK